MSRAGIPLRSLDVHFFDEIDSEAKAYWLGFLAADGYLSDRQIEVGLATRDGEHVYAFRAAVGSNAAVQHKPKSVRVAISSMTMVRVLTRHGVTNRKTFTGRPWEGPEDLIRHYWRGLFDGDGGFEVRDYGQYGYWFMSLIGNEVIANAFADFANAVTGSSRRPRPVNGMWQYKVSGRPICRKLALALYGDSTISLKRKHDLALRLLATPEGESSRWWNPAKSYHRKTDPNATTGQLPLLTI